MAGQDNPNQECHDQKKEEENYHPRDKDGHGGWIHAKAIPFFGIEATPGRELTVEVFWTTDKSP